LKDTPRVRLLLRLQVVHLPRWNAALKNRFAAALGVGECRWRRLKSIKADDKVQVLDVAEIVSKNLK